MSTFLRTAIAKYVRAGTLTRSTRAEYQTTLTKWNEWGGGVTLEKLGRTELRDFLDWVYQRAIDLKGNNPGRTVNKAREHLRAVMAWDQDLIATLPRFPKPWPQREVAGRHYLTKTELNALYFATHQLVFLARKLAINCVSWYAELVTCGGVRGRKPESLTIASSDGIELERVAHLDTSPWYQVRRADSWKALGEHQRALDDFAAAIRLRPNDSLAWNNRGNLYRAMGRHDLALRDYDRAVTLNPRDRFALVNRGCERLRLQQYELASADFSVAIPLAPARIDGWYFRGNCQRHLAKPRAAAADYTEVLRRAPEHFDALLWRGWCWIELRDFARAEADLLAARRLTPRHSQACFQLARLQCRRDRIDEAISLYTICLENDPTDTPALNNRGYCWIEKRDFDKARRDFEALRRLRPNDARAYLGLGNIADDENRLDEALGYFAQVWTLDPNNAAAHFNAGLVLQRKKQVRAAAAAFSETIRLSPHHVAAHINRGRIRASLRHYPEALADFETWVRLASDSANAANQLAWFLSTCPRADLRNGPRAVELANKAVKLSKETDFNKLDTLAAALAETGQFDAAVGVEQQALDRAPGKEKPVLQQRLALYKTRQPFQWEPPLPAADPPAMAPAPRSRPAAPKR